jgi:hypothetical protein
VVPLALHRRHGVPFIARFLEGDDRRSPLTLCPGGLRIQERIEIPEVLTHDHRVHARQPLGLLGIDGNPTGMGLGRTHHSAVKGPRWSGQVLRVNGLPRAVGSRIDTRRLDRICPHGGHQSSSRQRKGLRKLQAVVILPSSHSQWIPAQRLGPHAVWEPV